VDQKKATRGEKATIFYLDRPKTNNGHGQVGEINNSKKREKADPAAGQT